MTSTSIETRRVTPMALAERFRAGHRARHGREPAEALDRFVQGVLAAWSSGGSGPVLSDADADLADARSEASRALIMLAEIVADALLAQEPAPSAREVADSLLALQRCGGAAMEELADAAERKLLNRSRDALRAHRQKLAREVHDEFGNGLSVVMRRLELYKLSLQRDPEQAPERFEVLSRSVAELFDVVRWLTTDLTPCAGPSQLETMLGDFLAAVEPAGIRVGIAVHGWEHWLTDEVRCEVGTVVREALRNTLRHAGASQVSVHVHVAPDSVRAMVTDDGRGLTPAGHGRGHGMRSMRERVMRFGGTLEVTASPQGGTRIDAWIPFEPVEAVSFPSLGHR